jgi:hypothetical protein
MVTSTFHKLWPSKNYITQFCKTFEPLVHLPAIINTCVHGIKNTVNGKGKIQCHSFDYSSLSMKKTVALSVDKLAKQKKSLETQHLQ